MLEKNEILKKLKNPKNSDELKIILEKNKNNWCKYDNEVIYYAMQSSKTISEDLENYLFYDSIHRGAEDRYLEFLNSYMVQVDGQIFDMGTASDSDMHYCGEQPRHSVHINTFKISKTVITNEIYSRFIHNTCETENFPVVNINWFDAYVFSKWINCSLPTEAEWELASGKQEKGHWCCKESELCHYAWYSENSEGLVHEVARKHPNKWGVYDMHGNIWEWVLDDYDEEYYKYSDMENPCCLKLGQYKSCRGGSIHAFSEMCRSEFRYYEPPNFKAGDLGFRVVKRL